MSQDHDAQGDNDNLTIEPTPFTRPEARADSRRIPLKPVPVAIGVLFLVLAVAVAFMFTARAVRFNVEPAPESITVAEGFSYRLGERFLMLPGEYRVQASLTGYQMLNQTVAVTTEADQDFNFELKRLPGILHIETEPEVAAEVYLDQKPLGTTPLTLDEVSPGLHDVRLASERYLPYDTEIEIEGKRIEQAITAKLEPAWADITIDSLPGDANILVDGETVGTTPATVEILEGEREIQVQKPGYKIWQTTVDVAASEPRELEIARLVRSDGKVSLETDPPGANVTIGGRYRGQSPLEVALRPGETYPVVLSKAGFNPVERTIRVEPEQDIALNARLTPVLGVIRLFVEPKGAELFVDGKSMGAPVNHLELTVRNHEIRVTKDGYAPFETVVTPQPGQDQQLMISLQTEEEARVASIPDTVSVGPGVELKLILPGELEMGAGRREPGRRSNEIEKDVRLTKPFYLGTKEVTNAQFKEFSPSHESGVLGRSLLGEDDRPVVNVSWQDAARFCNWLSEKEGLPPAYVNDGGTLRPAEPLTTGYRLPTEAEWAWAARYASGPNPTRFPWGDAMPPREVHANYADVSAANMVPYHIANYNDTFRGPGPVGEYAPNAFGIHDLAGNVSEWIHDYYSIALPDGVLVDPTGPAQGEYHVVRGSNYTHGRFSELRWTFRDYGAEPRPEVGFRVARFVE